MPVRHVQIFAISVSQIAKANPEWNNVKNYAWLVLKPVVNAQMLAEVWLLILQNQQINVLKPAVVVPKPAVHVLKNVKSINIWSIAEDVPKLAGIVPKPVRLLHNEITGDMDKDFVSMMIMLHQAAVDLAKDELLHEKNFDLKKISSKKIILLK